MSDSRYSGSPATDRQKECARQLGISFLEDITRAEISKLIDEVVVSRDEKRYQQLDELEQRENEAWEKMRAEVLAEIDADPDDCRLSKAGKSQIVEELSRRGLAAVLITTPWDNFDPDNLVGVSFTMSFSDDMPLDDAETMIKSTALTFWKRDGKDFAGLMGKTSQAIDKASHILEQVYNVKNK